MLGRRNAKCIAQAECRAAIDVPEARFRCFSGVREAVLPERRPIDGEAFTAFRH